MHEINIGIIGYGFMGKTHTYAIKTIPLYYPDLEFRPVLKGVCSRKLDVAKNAADSQGFEFFTDDYRELLARDDIDAVSICTPNNLHETMMLDALKAGKHVYIDKPLSISNDSANRLMKAAQDSNLTCQMVMNCRFWPSTMGAKQLMEEGRIGTITSFRINYLHSGSVDENKPISWKQDLDVCGGGVLFDLGSHALDMLYWLCGEVNKIFCRTNNLYNKRPTKGGEATSNLGDDMALMLVELKDGAIGTVEASKIATGANDELSFEINGTKGAVRWNSMDANWLHYFDNTLPESPLGGMRGWTRIECVGRYPLPGGQFLPPKNTVGWVRAHVACYYTFLDALFHNKPTSPSIVEGAYIQMLMEKAYESNNKGAWQTI